MTSALNSVNRLIDPCTILYCNVSYSSSILKVLHFPHINLETVKLCDRKGDVENVGRRQCAF